ncbi:MAG: transglutaminase-like domain-containing protein [Tannerella sp.]|jgi:hypothetical protein|nr:transglutaminase-like domain-containing protein [Tannerella sp.]
MKYIFLLLPVIFLFSCAEKVTIEQIDNQQNSGNFAEAARLINLYMAENKFSEQDIYDLNFRKDVMRRIELDFNKTKDDVTAYIQKYYPGVDDTALDKWVADGSLEAMTINGERKYFDRAAPNLFRINRDAKRQKEHIDGGQNPDAITLFKQKDIPEIVAGEAQSVTVKIKYAVTLKPDAVPDGETVRCWLPFPNENCSRQSEIRLISANDSNYVISPKEYAHRTLYMQKIARKGEPLTFEIAFSYRSVPVFADVENSRSGLFQLSSEETDEYLSERPPHIVFSKNIKDLSEKIIGNEKDPVLKVKRIFEYIDQNYPWAGAREYSTVPNIPEYVMENGHGDCGMKTLLFITLARYNGIPAKWESGFMVHPGAKNLHDWGAYFVDGRGWIPVDQSFGLNKWADETRERYFYMTGTDAYHLAVNTDYSRPLFPEKIHPRSETVDFQRGELEWRGGNLYFDAWDWDWEVEYGF